MYYPLSWEKLHLLSHSLAKKIQQKAHIDCIVTIAKGGLTIAHIIGNELDLPVTSFTVSTYLHMEQKTNPELTFSVAKEIADKNLLLLDDIADTGATFEFGLSYLKELQPLSVTTAALFYKPHSTVLPDFYVEKVDSWVIFPFEYRETMEVYEQLKKEDQTKAQELMNAIQQMDLPDLLK